MPSLQIRDLPEELYAAIKKEAELEHRSLTQQAMVILRRGLLRDGRARRAKLLDRIKQDRKKMPTISEPDIVAWIREDRDR